MITQIRNKITAVGETVTANFFYQQAPKDQAYPYCVYKFFGNDYVHTTEDSGEHIYFQVACYQRTDGLVETLADSIITAFEAANMDTTNYTEVELKTLRRVPYPLEVDNKAKCLILEFYLWVEYSSS